jgi:glycosyltransferase involved in cell wall biosynthesis
MMKIVCIAASFVPANTANSIQVVKVAHALAELGHDVTLIVPGVQNASGDGQISWDELQAHYGLQQRFKIRWLKENLLFRRYDFALKAVAAACKDSPELIYTWMLQAGVPALWRGIPVVLELHDRVTGQMGPWLFRRFWRSGTPHRLLTNTHALWEVLKVRFELDEGGEEWVRIAPNGVELERYQGLPGPAEARKDLGLSRTPTIGYTGHFYAGRGLELMMDVAKSLPHFSFLWVGGQAQDVTLWQERLAAAGVSNVVLTGFVENALLPRYQAAADILLMPYGRSIAGSGGGNSAEIASPMKMFEYMAAGRPIITSDLPVIREVLDETMAVFCPPETPAAWQAAIEALMENPDRRHALGAAAKAAVSEYTWRARAEKALADFIKSS